MLKQVIRLVAMAAIVYVLPVTVRAQTKPSSSGDSPPSLDQLRQMFHDGRYQEVVKQATKIFAMRGEAARTYDRHEVTLLKAESHLRLGQTELAIDGFEDAAASAPDARTSAVERATVQLIQKSKRSSYTPKSPAPDATAKPIDILDAASRKLAFRALFADERAEAQVKIDKAKESDLLPPTLDAVEQVARLRMIEQAASASDADSSKLLKPLSKRAKSMMTSEIKSSEKRIDQIEKAANKKKKVASAYRKQGLSPRDPDELRDAVQTCQRIADTCRQLAQSVPEDASAFDEIRLDAQRAAKHAEEVLNADYTGNFDRP